MLHINISEPPPSLRLSVKEIHKEICFISTIQCHFPHFTCGLQYIVLVRNNSKISFILKDASLPLHNEISVKRFHLSLSDNKLEWQTGFKHASICSQENVKDYEDKYSLISPLFAHRETNLCKGTNSKIFAENKSDY